MEDRALARRAALVTLAVLLVFAPAVGGMATGTATPGAALAAASNGSVTETPTPDGNETTPSDNESAGGDNETATPTPTNGTATPTSDNGTATPTPDNATSTPTPDNATATPTPGNEILTPTPETETPTPTPGAGETPTDETPTNETPTDETPTNETPTDETPTNETPTNETPTNETPTPPGMAVDPLGWEGGFWHNDTLPIDRGDGLNRTEIGRVVARTMARVEEIRGLEFNRTVPVRLRSRAAYRRALADRSVNGALRTFDNAKFEALFLVGESRNSIDVMRENAAGSVLGYYDPRNDSIVLLVDADARTTSTPPPGVTVGARGTAGGSARETTNGSARNGSADLLAGNASVRIDERTLAHELLHALQDQRFGLEGYAGGTREEANALDALIEGDATLVERRYTRRCRDAWAGTCLTADGGGGDLANTGVYLVTYQPYSDGPGFVREFYRRGGWAAVNDLYDRPPASTEQVIHPEKYPADVPANVSLADETAGEWTRVRPPGRPDHAELGEAAIAAAFVYPLYDSNGRVQIVRGERFFNRTGSGLSASDPFDYGQTYSDGWDGDRLHVYRNDDNETAYVWKLVWDSPDEASEFYRGYRQLLAYWGASRVGEDTFRVAEGGFADAFHVHVDGSTVTVVNAPTVATLREVRTGLSEEIGVSQPPETLTLPADAKRGVPTQPGFGAGAAVLALVALVYGRLRNSGDGPATGGDCEG